MVKTFIDEMYSKEDNNKKNSNILARNFHFFFLRNIFPVRKGPNCEKIPKFLETTIEILKKLHNANTINLFIITKEIYLTLMEGRMQTPKIITKTPNTNFNSSFKSLNKPFYLNKPKTIYFNKFTIFYQLKTDLKRFYDKYKQYTITVIKKKT